MTPRDRRDADERVLLADDAGSSGDGVLADAGLPAESESGAGTTAAVGRRASLAHRLYNGEAGLDVVGRSKLIYRITAVVLVICLASFILRGFNFGIEFVGSNS